MGFDGFPIEFHFLLGCEKQAESNPTSKNERKDCLSPTLEKFNFNYQGFSRKREMFEVSRCSLQKKKKVYGIFHASALYFCERFWVFFAKLFFRDSWGVQVKCVQKCCTYNRSRTVLLLPLNSSLVWSWLSVEVNWFSIINSPAATAAAGLCRLIKKASMAVPHCSTHTKFIIAPLSHRKVENPHRVICIICKFRKKCV